MTGLICDRMRIAAAGELQNSASGSDRIDSIDAALVERAWRALAPKHRELLRWHYVRSAAPGFICRRMGFKVRPTSIFDLELARAEAEIENGLRDMGARASSFPAMRARGQAAAPFAGDIL